MNLPNRLTMLRILMIPVFVAFLSFPDLAYNYLWAGIIFAIASFTDYLDGAIARKQGIVTNFGKFADPLADKILTTTAFLYMMQDGVCHPIVLVIILAREFAVSGVRMVAASSPESKVIAADGWGKAKTVLQMLSIIFYYLALGVAQMMDISVLSLGMIQMITMVLCWLVAVLTAISGARYIIQSKDFINTTK